jgi:hypothetical protein
MSLADLVTDEMIERKLTGWTESEWDGVRENWMEYRAALGPEATKTLRQFAWTQAAMNCLATVLQEAK